MKKSLSTLGNSYFLNLSVGFLFWLVFYPGLFSTDSFAAYEMAKNGELNNSWTASWAVYVRALSFHGNFIALVTLVNCFLLIYSLTRLSSVVFEKRTARWASLVICATPSVSGMGITLWHDIPMTAGLLLISASAISFKRENQKFSKRILLDLVIGSSLVTFRPNGIPTLVLVLLIVLAVKNLRQASVILGIGIVISTLFSSVMSFGFVRQPLINTYFAQEWMRNDISCFASKHNSQIFGATTKIPENEFEQWKSREACGFLNRAQLADEEKNASLNYVPKAWINLVQKDTLFVLITHSERHSYLLPLPLFGIPNPPFMHTNIEFQDKGVEWAFEKQASAFRNYFRVWNYLRGITAWAGLWLVILLILSLMAQRVEFKLLLIMSIGLILILFVFAPIPDGRYALYVLLSAQLSLLGFIVEKTTRERVLNDN